MPRWLTAQVNREHKASFGGLNILQEGNLWKVIQFNAIKEAFSDVPLYQRIRLFFLAVVRCDILFC